MSTASVIAFVLAVGALCLVSIFLVFCFRSDILDTTLYHAAWIHLLPLDGLVCFSVLFSLVCTLELDRKC